MRAPAVVWFAAFVLLAEAAAAQTVPADSLAAIVNAAPRARVFLDRGRSEVERPRLQGDTLSWARGVILDRRSGAWVPMREPVTLEQVMRIEIRRGNRAGRGALIGGCVGVALGVILSSTEPRDSYAHPGAGGTVTLALLGAVTGAFIGANTGRWEPVYHRP